MTMARGEHSKVGRRAARGERTQDAIDSSQNVRITQKIKRHTVASGKRRKHSNVTQFIEECFHKNLRFRRVPCRSSESRILPSAWLGIHSQIRHASAALPMAFSCRDSCRTSSAWLRMCYRVWWHRLMRLASSALWRDTCWLGCGETLDGSPIA